MLLVEAFKNCNMVVFFPFFCPSRDNKRFVCMVCGWFVCVCVLSERSQGLSFQFKTDFFSIVMSPDDFAILRWHVGNEPVHLNLVSFGTEHCSCNSQACSNQGKEC